MPHLTETKCDTFTHALRLVFPPIYNIILQYIIIYIISNNISHNTRIIYSLFFATDGYSGARKFAATFYIEGLRAESPALY